MPCQYPKRRFCKSCHTKCCQSKLKDIVKISDEINVKCLGVDEKGHVK
jgi:polyribonucleotide nucleotidyltransferase